MKLPTKTEIFGIPFNITWVKTSEVDIHVVKVLFGQIQYDERKIRVSNEINNRDKYLALFEEFLHGVLCEMEYHDLNHDHKFITPLVNGMFTALEKAGVIKICP